MEFVKSTRGCLMEKLALIPTTKLIVEDFLEVDTNIPPETLAVRFSWGDKKALAIIQDLLNKRWMTLDLLSILQESQRTLPLMQISFLKMNFISVMPSFIVTHFIYTKICLASQDFVRMNKSQRQVIYK